MKAFVTGSTGLLGSEVVRQLLAEGYAVKAMARTKEKGEKILGNTAAEIVIGDMLDIPAFTPHMADCDVVFHVAAYFKEYNGVDEAADKMLQAVNVDGTIAILAAAKAQGVRNVIYVSSSGVVGRSPSGTSDETSGFNHDTSNQYFQSKIRAEEAVAKWLPNNPDMRVILIRPGAIIGPGDNGPTGMGQMLIEVLQRKLPATPPGNINYVDVRDVAAAMVNAIEQGRSGEAYCITGHPGKVADIAKMAANAGDVKPPAISMPFFMLYTYAFVMEMIARMTGGEPQVTRVIARTLNEGIISSSAKAERELGATFRPTNESIIDSVAWFKANGYV